MDPVERQASLTFSKVTAHKGLITFTRGSVSPMVTKTVSMLSIRGEVK